MQEDVRQARRHVDQQGAADRARRPRLRRRHPVVHDVQRRQRHVQGHGQLQPAGDPRGGASEAEAESQAQSEEAGVHLPGAVREVEDRPLRDQDAVARPAARPVRADARVHRQDEVRRRDEDDDACASRSTRTGSCACADRWGLGTRGAAAAAPLFSSQALPGSALLGLLLLACDGPHSSSASPRRQRWAHPRTDRLHALRP